MSTKMGKLMADAVGAVHFIVLMFGVAMLPIAVISPGYRTLMALCAAGLLLVWAMLHDCPLRTIEHKLRLRFHPEGAHGDPFVYHNLFKPLGIPKRATT